jgi:hypothetical protein
MEPVDRVALAARNNAEWCDTVTRCWGGRGEFRSGLWLNSGEAPPFYPNAVTLMPMDQVPRPVAEAGDGFSVKDSYAQLDLAPLDYVPLFEATWIWRDPAAAPRSDAATWRVVRDAADLAHWLEAWQGGDEASPFQPALLDERRYAFIAAAVAGRIVAGCVASRSDEVAGLSNLFGPDDLAAGCLAAVQAFAPDLPVVGYESEAALEIPEIPGDRPLAGMAAGNRLRAGESRVIPNFGPRIDV